MSRLLLKSRSDQIPSCLIRELIPQSSYLKFLPLERDAVIDAVIDSMHDTMILTKTRPQHLWSSTSGGHLPIPYCSLGLHR